jgi:hypothetical protein
VVTVAGTTTLVAGANNITLNSSNEAGACNDIVIGILDDEGGLLHYLMDSRRFRPADQSKRGA